jgi:hypothetical protein
MLGSRPERQGFYKDIGDVFQTSRDAGGRVSRAFPLNTSPWRIFI